MHVIPIMQIFKYPIDVNYSSISVGTFFFTSLSGPKRNSIDYSRNNQRINRRQQIYTDIIRLFGDYPHTKCPFGIHK